MLCGKMSAPGRQLPVGRFYAARSRETGTAQTGATQICSSPSFLARASSLMRTRVVAHARAHGILACAAVRSEIPDAQLK